MKLAAFDPSMKSCGVAWGSASDGAPSTTSWSMPKDNHARALSVARNAAAGMFKFHGITHAVIEGPLMKINQNCSADSLWSQVTLTGVLLEAAWSCGIRPELVEIEKWRQTFLGGGGRFSTEDAKAGSLTRCRQLGWSAQNHDAAEACGIWFWKMASAVPTWRPRRAA